MVAHLCRHPGKPTAWPPIWIEQKRVAPPTLLWNSQPCCALCCDFAARTCRFLVYFATNWRSRSVCSNPVLLVFNSSAFFHGTSLLSSTAPSDTVASAAECRKSRGAFVRSTHLHWPPPLPPLPGLLVEQQRQP